METNGKPGNCTFFLDSCSTLLARKSSEGVSVIAEVVKTVIIMIMMIIIRIYFKTMEQPFFQKRNSQALLLNKEITHTLIHGSTLC